MVIRFVDIQLRILKEVIIPKAEQHIPMMPASTLPNNIFATATTAAEAYQSVRGGGHRKKD
jgi:hypothetical protein